MTVTSTYRAPPDRIEVRDDRAHGDGLVLPLGPLAALTGAAIVAVLVVVALTLPTLVERGDLIT